MSWNAVKPGCVVVGGGVVGVVAALRLSERGADVTLVDAARVGSGTSGTTFAHVNASYAGYWDYFEPRAAGVAGYRRLRSELGSTTWLFDTGFLQFEDSPQRELELAEHAERLRDAGYSVSRVTREHAARLEPDLVIPGDIGEVFFYPDEGYVAVQPMLAHLLRAAAPGVVVRQNQRVVEVRTTGERVRGVTLDSGEQLDADVVVSSCGRWTDSVIRLAGIDLSVMAPDAPGSTAPGLIVVSSPVVSGLQRVVSADGLNLRPAGDGRLMLWSSELDARLQAEDAASGLARESIEAGRRYVPALEGASAETAHVCMRALPRDGLPVVGWIPGVEGLYVLVAHAAVTLAPILGEVAASEITGRREHTMFDRFRPDRFSSLHSSEEGFHVRSCR
jgi:glycine/D-amino acid oxidase-like deaminating enzyme